MEMFNPQAAWSEPNNTNLYDNVCMALPIAQTVVRDYTPIVFSLFGPGGFLGGTLAGTGGSAVLKGVEVSVCSREAVFFAPHEFELEIIRNGAAFIAFAVEQVLGPLGLLVKGAYHAAQVAVGALQGFNRMIYNIENAKSFDHSDTRMPEKLNPQKGPFTFNYTAITFDPNNATLAHIQLEKYLEATNASALEKKLLLNTTSPHYFFKNHSFPKELPRAKRLNQTRRGKPDTLRIQPKEVKKRQYSPDKIEHHKKGALQ